MAVKLIAVGIFCQSCYSLKEAVEKFVAAFPGIQNYTPEQVLWFSHFQWCSISCIIKLNFWSNGKG